VSEVVNIAEGKIDAPPVIGNAVDTGSLLGMGKVGDKVVLLLDIEKVLMVEGVDISAMQTTGIMQEEAANV